MTEDEAGAQAELRNIVAELGTVCLRLEAIHHRLPESPHEQAMLLGEQETDIAAVVRSTIAAVLSNHLVPTVRDLEGAALYRRPQPDSGETSKAPTTMRARKAGRSGKE